MQNKAASAKAEDAGGVRPTSASHGGIGPVGATAASPTGGDSGGVQPCAGSQAARGPAATKPVPVAAHRRHFPGHARIGLAEATIAAKLAPAVYAPALSDGRKVMPMTYREARQEQPKRQRDAVYLAMVLAYAQPSDDMMRLQDAIPEAIFKQREDWTREWMDLAGRRIEMTVEAFITMKERQVGMALEVQQIQP